MITLCNNDCLSLVVIQYLSLQQMGKEYVDRIKEAFEQKGFKGNSQINKTKFNEVLSSLTSGQAYDRDVADQLWEQASGGNILIEISSVCQTINEGINILQVKIQEINDEIRQLQKQRIQANNASNGPNRSLLAKIENDLANLHQDLQEYEEDLKLVTLPFGINTMGRNSGLGHDYSRSRVGDSLNDSGVSGQNEQLRYILYFSIVIGIIQIIIIYGKFDFLNLMVVTCLLSIYLLNHFDNIYIKLSLILLIVSEVLDIIWLFMYASQKWDPPSVGNDSSYERQYLRFIVFFTVVVIAIKIPIGYYLYKIKNINDSKYTLSMGLFKIILNANKSNPITRNLTNLISTP